jgi:hypothetical protein
MYAIVSRDLLSISSFLQAFMHTFSSLAATTDHRLSESKIQQPSQPSMGLAGRLLIYPPDSGSEDQTTTPQSQDQTAKQKKQAENRGELTRFGFRVDTAISS